MIGLAAVVVSLLLCGWLSDLPRRRKPFVFASTLLIGTGLAAPMLSPLVTGFLVYVAVAGLGFGCLAAIDMPLMSQVLPAEQNAARDLRVAGVAAHLPQVVAPALAGTIVAGEGSYRPLFVLAFGVCVLGSLCVVPIKSVR